MEYTLQPSPRGSGASRYTQVPGYLAELWFPILTFGGANAGMTGSYFATYTKIGDRCFFDVTFTLTAKGASVGNAVIEDMPLTRGQGVNSACAMYWVNMTTALVMMVGIPGGTGVDSELFIGGLAAGGTSIVQLTNADFANNSAITCSGVYNVNN
jgi:hypothetical protein